MGLLTTADLDGMRTTLNQSLPDTCVIMRPAVTDDGQGGQTQAYAASGTVACRLSPHTSRQTGDEEVRGNRVAGVLERMITLPNATDVALTDQLHVGSQTFDVTAIHAPRSYEIDVRVDAIQVS